MQRRYFGENYDEKGLEVRMKGQRSNEEGEEGPAEKLIWSTCSWRIEGRDKGRIVFGKKEEEKDLIKPMAQGIEKRGLSKKRNGRGTSTKWETSDKKMTKIFI